MITASGVTVVYFVLEQDTLSAANAPVICIHAPPPPTYGDSGGIPLLWCSASTFGLSPQCQGSAGVITLGHLPW